MELTSELVFHEIFNILHLPSEMALNHLLERIEENGFLVKKIDNHDHAIVIEFCRPGDHQINGELRIDRIRRIFDIIAMVDGEVALPASGNWELVIEYLQNLVTLNNVHIQ